MSCWQQALLCHTCTAYFEHNSQNCGVRAISGDHDEPHRPVLTAVVLKSASTEAVTVCSCHPAYPAVHNLVSRVTAPLLKPSTEHSLTTALGSLPAAQSNVLCAPVPAAGCVVSCSQLVRWCDQQISSTSMTQISARKLPRCLLQTIPRHHKTWLVST